MDYFWHEHKIHDICVRYLDECSGCANWLQDSKYRDTWLKDPTRQLGCGECRLKWHTSCVPSSPENINHPCHPSHPLELLLHGPPNYSNGICSICGGKLTNFVYHCKSCDFTVDAKCANHPPPFTVDHPKCHDHALTVIGREVTFTCNACGTHGERSPYVCHPCSLMFHYDCIELPHVININRHDHRVSHTYPLTPGDRTCEICRQDINWRYGAYKCNKCPYFFVHSKCATRKDVWDGVELEGILEEEVDTAPFKVIDEGIINHFSHEEHNLLLIEEVIIDGSGESIHCEGCCRPISFERYYKCMECDFMLHEECANLPLQKRHALSTNILYLSTGTGEDDDKIFDCTACLRSAMGFRYSAGDYSIELDVHCASLSWFRHRKLHRHTLFLTTVDKGSCVGCGDSNKYVLSCVECKYSLDFKCATLPVVTKHRCDDHYLFLSSGDEKATGKYWCEICEAETNPQKWFYTCHDCGVVCHIGCVIGDSLNIKPGILTMSEESKMEMVLNNHHSRPLCLKCGSRCTNPMISKWSGYNFENHICSFSCAAKR